jgi:hypothetical protein
MKEKPVWHKTEDALPEQNKAVLGRLYNGRYDIVYYTGKDWGSNDGLLSSNLPTHWMEIPEIPNEDTDSTESHISDADWNELLRMINPEIIDFFIADRIAKRLNNLLEVEPELINKLVLPREARESPPTVIGLLNTMFSSKVRIVYEVEEHDDTITRICAVRHYPPVQKHIS